MRRRGASAPVVCVAAAAQLKAEDREAKRWLVAWRMLERSGAAPAAVADALEHLRAATDVILDGSELARAELAARAEAH